MDSKICKAFGALLFLPLAVLLASASAANDSDDAKTDMTAAPDLVITEDTQIALHGRNGKAVTGSCKYEDPLWEGKIALKNIGNKTIEVPEEDEEEERETPVVPPVAGEKRVLSAAEEKRRREREEHPHVRAYVPNNIEFRSGARLTHSLDEFGHELVTLSIGKGKNKCRNYDAPPVFDEHLSGVTGPLPAQSLPPPFDGFGWRIKRIQHALIQKGYPLRPDGDYGPETARAVAAYFRDRRIPPPPGIHEKPVAPETVSFLLEALAASGEGDGEEADAVPTGGVGGDECKRGVNLVPIYVEIDPERTIPDENRTNNRVQFTVAIDCSNFAR